MIWNSVAECANSTEQTITASGYARMMIASITHWKPIIRMGAWIMRKENDGAVKHI